MYFIIERLKKQKYAFLGASFRRRSEMMLLAVRPVVSRMVWLRWLVYYKPTSGQTRVSCDDAVDIRMDSQRQNTRNAAEVLL